MTSVISLPFEKQDRLEDGLLKVNIGASKEEFYADIFVCSRKAGGESKAFAELSEQDKLKEGMIKVAGGEYMPVDKLGEIETITEVDITKDHDDEHFFGYGRVCFVATAVYGNANHPNVLRLQEFKRDVLMRNPCGRVFTEFYYSGAGKGIADFVKEHLPSSIPVIRKCLDFFVDKYSKK